MKGTLACMRVGQRVAVGALEGGTFGDLREAFATSRAAFERDFKVHSIYESKIVFPVWDGVAALAKAMGDLVFGVRRQLGGAPSDKANDAQIMEVYDYFHDAMLQNTRYAVAIKSARTAKNTVVAFPDTRFKSSIVNVLRMGEAVCKTLGDYAKQTDAINALRGKVVGALRVLMAPLTVAKVVATEVVEQAGNVVKKVVPTNIVMWVVLGLLAVVAAPVLVSFASRANTR